MFCDRCGTKLAEEALACSSCGKLLTAPASPKRTIEGHVKLLGILWIAHGALHAVPGLALMTIFSARFLPPDVPPFIFNFMPFLGGLFLLGGTVSVIVGVGLLMRLSWARMGALILGALNLLSIPFGTALGIYTLWALLPAEHEQEYRTLSQIA